MKAKEVKPLTEKGFSPARPWGREFGRGVLRQAAAGRSILVFIAFLVLALSGCGADYQFKQAQKLEKNGYYVEAGFRYQEICKKYPANPICPEALYRLGRIYQKKLKLYSQAVNHYKKLIEYYPSARPWAGLAKVGLFECPDYFPLSRGSFWIEGDSETEGRNMRAEWDCQAVSTGTFLIAKRLFAGANHVTDIKRYYRKEDLQLREYSNLGSGVYSVALQYPFESGKYWQTNRDGRKVLCGIVANNLSIKVKAGEFSGCLKISEENPELPGSVRYNYYAPDTGWILTTTSAAGGSEHRNTELLSYKIAQEN